MSAIKEAIKSGRTVAGTTVTPDIDVSILAAAGYDFLLFDTQHRLGDQASSCGRQSRRCAASRLRRWCASLRTRPI